ncbi:helix-turn-helix domain-containing protein [Chitinophaga pinensis]|uniref:Transcriptional regulator, XRE family n=1 Tax=Chitinophaga pinensis (strain ATCC 43595 / DSM 2588 / LMG 13176 / NBRC 15968 / NCIMB 11800 / UQM 2034) TaxID=485918 RepID=A0A979GRD9_CHIPD|nr:XRE family transcriptional regulator [Chitinophaga pinensis]ACU62272.1 transcriptional regulator, XRE family [Chitinophaga pinensis DSM 2588]
MKEDTLVQISNRIKEKRREKNITVQDLADRAKVSKGLISQIENSRTIPSLIVLIDIIRALEIDLNVFFKDISTTSEQPLVLVKKPADYDPFEKEDAIGFFYKRIFTQSVNKGTVDIVLLELEPGANRPMVQTEAFEYKYMISGDVEYNIGGDTYQLSKGDSLLFDGRISHTPRNTGTANAVMLVIYFFENKEA